MVIHDLDDLGVTPWLRKPPLFVHWIDGNFPLISQWEDHWNQWDDLLFWKVHDTKSGLGKNKLSSTYLQYFSYVCSCYIVSTLERTCPKPCLAVPQFFPRLVIEVHHEPFQLLCPRSQSVRRSVPRIPSNGNLYQKHTEL
jgi:hypothetical protein